MQTWVAGSLLAVSLVLSGCIGAGEKQATPASTSKPAAPAFDAQTAAIRGAVLSLELLPVEGALVGLRDPPMETRTAPDGRFLFNNVPPGERDVFVSALGYQAAGRRVKLDPGTVTDEVVIVLQPMPSDKPYHVTDIKRVSLTGAMWKVTPDCIYTTVNPLVKTCGGIRFVCGDPDQCETHYGAREDFTPEWQTIIGEVTWRGQSGLTGRGFSFDVNVPNITRGSGGSINQADSHTFVKATSKAPIVIRIDRETLVERKIPESDWYNYPNNDCAAPSPDKNETPNCDWFWRLFPAACDLGNCPERFGPDYGLSYENPAEVHFTYFVRAAAPADFTSLEP